MIRGFALRLLHNQQPADVAALFDRAVAHGANAVSIIPHHYCYLDPGTPNLTLPPTEFFLPWFIYPDVGQDAMHPFINTPNEDLVYQTCMTAELKGLQVILKPHLDSYYGDWRGNISVARYPARFYTDYKERFLRRYINIVNRLHDPIFVLGTELYTATKEMGADFWVNIASWIRSTGYRGRLTYAANWGFGLDAEYNRLEALWPHLDYVGIDAYFPLVPTEAPPSPDYETVLAGWDRRTYEWAPPPAVDMLLAAERAGKPLLFTEIGCGNNEYGAHYPWKDAKDGWARNDTLQADYYRAFKARFTGERAFAGSIAWEMWLGPQADFSHSIIDRPAEDIAFRELP